MYVHEEKMAEKVGNYMRYAPAFDDAVTWTVKCLV